jgi:hypothetical protein
MKCEIVDTIFYNGTISDLKTWIQEHPNYFLQSFFYHIQFHNISKEKLLLLIQTYKIWITQLSMIESMHDFLIEYASIEMFIDICKMDEFFVKRYLEKIDTKKTILELKKNNQLCCLLGESMYPMYKDLIERYLELDDIKEYHMYPWVVKSLISKFGKNSYQEYQPKPYTFIRDCRTFAMLYTENELSDEIYWYFIQNYINTPTFEYIKNHKEYNFYSCYTYIMYDFKEKNKLFQYLQRESFQTVWKKYYKLDNSLQNYFSKFILYQSKKLKPGDITYETLHTFFKQMGEMTIYFTTILQNMLSCFDLKEIDLHMTTIDHLGKSYSYLDFIQYDVKNEKQKQLLHQVQSLFNLI